MENIYKAWRSTVVAILLIVVLVVLVWFEKLSTEALLGILPLLLPIFKDYFKENKKSCTHGKEDNTPGA